MQTKQIVLAAAALVSGAALAQSNVQIYGSIDMGFSHRGDNVRDGVKSQNAIDSGISSGNRLGFRGTEDIGNGLKATFTLEAGYAADTGNHTQSSRLFGRQVFVGLTGNFGTVIAGRLYTPHYTLLSAIDPFKGGTVGMYRNIFAAGATTGGENLFDPTRVDNTVAYVIPFPNLK
jgi:predicted porin